MSDMTIRENMEKYRDIDWESRCRKMQREVISYLQGSFLVEHKYGMVIRDREMYHLEQGQVGGVHTVVFLDLIFIARGKGYEVIEEELMYLAEKYEAEKVEMVNMFTPGNHGERLFRLFFSGDPLVHRVAEDLKKAVGPNPKGNVELYREAWMVLRDEVSR